MRFVSCSKHQDDLTKHWLLAEQTIVYKMAVKVSLGGKTTPQGAFLLVIFRRKDFSGAELYQDSSILISS